ncbi:Floculation protein FLO1 [Trichoderma chlorosporum]
MTTLSWFSMALLVAHLSRAAAFDPSSNLGPNIKRGADSILGDDLLPLPCDTTVTIPWVGTYTTSTTIVPCGTGPATLVVQTPIVATKCYSTPSTAIPTSTPGGPCPLVNPRCPASGLDIEYYSNPFAGYSNLPWSYYITQNLEPLESSTTNITFFPQDHGPPDNLPKVYPRADLPGVWYAVGWTKETNGGVVVDANNFTLVYSGFYRAPETGKYTLCTTADNENEVFFGHGNAFSCLNGDVDISATPLVVSTGGNYINGIKYADVDLVKGAYYPLRSVMGDWQGPSAFNLTIKTPSLKFEDRRNDIAGLAYPLSCQFRL